MSHTTPLNFHNPASGSSRNTRPLIRHSGVEPVVDAVNAERSRRVAP
jgi:hypothetical protein